jgi:hypothetical protein
MWFCPVNRMTLRPGLLWLTLNLALTVQRFLPELNLKMKCAVKCRETFRDSLGFI